MPLIYIAVLSDLLVLVIANYPAVIFELGALQGTNYPIGDLVAEGRVLADICLTQLRYQVVQGALGGNVRPHHVLNQLVKAIPFFDLDVRHHALISSFSTTWKSSHIPEDRSATSPSSPAGGATAHQFQGSSPCNTRSLRHCCRASGIG